MGLRTASVRHPHVAVMAPALTETNQSQSFKLSSAHPQSTSPINGTNVYISREGECKNENLNLRQSNAKELNNAFDNLNTLALATELLKENNCLGEINKASENNIMNNSSISMGDLEDKMGLQKIPIDSVSAALKDKNSSDVDQLLNNLGSEFQGSDICAATDDELMQVVLKSMGGSGDRLIQQNDLASEPDNMFALSNTDLTGNLSSFEKEFLNDVDMMSMSMEDQLLDGSQSKETQAKDMIKDLRTRQAKAERKLDFLIRRVRKMQVRHMGQHVSGEIAGVFEHVHRTLKKLKENVSAPNTTTNSLQPPEFSISTTENVSPAKLKAMSHGSLRSLVRKLEMSSILQANAASRQRHSPKYFGSGSSEPAPFRGSVSGVTNLPPWQTECKAELQKVAGLLHTELSVTQSEIDSEATASSSGGESADEMQNYNNPHQQPLSM